MKIHDVFNVSLRISSYYVDQKIWKKILLRRFRDRELQGIERDIVRHRQDNSTYCTQTLKLSKCY